MKIHYFQRYHKGEDVATANTMLMLSRLYNYSSNKFFQLLKDLFFADNDFEPEIEFVLQAKSDESRPDATITQESFKLVVETKMTDWFHNDQLIHHLSAFKDEKYKVLITLSSTYMNDKNKSEFDAYLKKYNEEHHSGIIHVNTTFKDLADGIEQVLDERDYEIKDILSDYLDYCYEDKLIVGPKMRVQLAGTTFDFNVKENVYYDNIERKFSAHEYLGLYKEKSVRAVGKIIAIITAELDDGKLKYNAEMGELTDERKAVIDIAIEDGKKYGYKLDAHRYFFVDKFYITDFKKATPRAPMGSRMFELNEYIGNDNSITAEELADKLKSKTWS